MADRARTNGSPKKPICATDYGAIIDDADSNTTAAVFERWYCVGVLPLYDLRCWRHS